MGHLEISSDPPQVPSPARDDDMRRECDHRQSEDDLARPGRYFTTGGQLKSAWTNPVRFNADVNMGDEMPWEGTHP
jgi:hypothetical protein